MVNAMPKVVDSPELDDCEDEHAVPLWFVLVKYTEAGMWRVWLKPSNNSEAIAMTESDGLKLLAEAKRYIDRMSKGSKLAAVGLRLGHSPAEEL